MVVNKFNVDDEVIVVSSMYGIYDGRKGIVRNMEKSISMYDYGIKFEEKDELVYFDEDELSFENEYKPKQCLGYWHSVNEEGDPKEDGGYFVTVSRKIDSNKEMCFVRELEYENKIWKFRDEYYFKLHDFEDENYKVIAWCKYPEPYKENN